jgi:hypothetical protein
MGRGVLGVLSGLGFALITGIGAGVASANPDFAIGQPTHGGTACPEGTVSKVFSPDHTVLALFFDNFEVTTEGKQKQATGTCNIQIPLGVKPGHRITGLTIDYRGYAYIPEGGKGKFVSKYVLGPKQFSTEDISFPGGWDDDFEMTHEFAQPEKKLKVKKWKWMLKNKFLCNEKVQFKIENTLHVQKLLPMGDDEAYGAIDSADVSPSVRIGLLTEPCPNGPNNLNLLTLIKP